MGCKAQGRSGVHRGDAEVFEKWNSMLSRERAALIRRRRFYEAGHEKIAAVYFENHGGFGPNGARIIFECGLVRRADLAQFCATGFENFADAKSAPDFHQFPP